MKHLFGAETRVTEIWQASNFFSHWPESSLLNSSSC